MTLTFGNIVAIILVAIGIEITCLFVAAAYESKMPVLISIPIIAVCVIVMIFGLSWWNTHTASGARSVKEYKSEFNNGLEREITISHIHICDISQIIFILNQKKVRVI